jgi:hypothetical protein
MHPEGIRSLVVDNAGGSSEISEAWSIDLISKTLNSKECVLETEIEYTLIYGMVDYILKIDTIFGHHRIGVSVTRAICNPWEPYTWSKGVRLLNKKINGLVMSHEAISFNQSFYQSILHIWVPSKEIAAMLLCIMASPELDVPNPSETLDIWITVTDYTPIFTNGSSRYPVRGLKDISYISTPLLTNKKRRKALMLATKLI